MLDAKDDTYFDMQGMLIYDPSISAGQVSGDIVVVPFVDAHPNLFPFNESYVEELHKIDESCGFSDFRDQYLTFPPSGQIPSDLPGVNPKTGEPLPQCADLLYRVLDAISLINPCFDIYQIATTCPLLWDVMGFPGSFDYLPEGASIYFDRQDVKKAINAPVNATWAECSGPVFVGQDTSPPSANSVLGGVVDRTKNVIIAHGALDMVLIANGTLLAIQNMTFGDELGFQTPPVEPFFVPYHHAGSASTLAGAGIFGTAHTERGLTYVGVNLAGHMIPQYAPSAAYRQLEFMLGRVDSLNSTAPFSTDRPSNHSSTAN